MSAFWSKSPGQEFIAPGAASAWDTMFLGLWDLPGLVDVDVTISRGIDVAKAMGQESATLRYTGVDPASVTIRVTTWTKPQYDALRPILTAIAPRKQKAPPPPLSVYHPKLFLAEVRAVVVKSITLFGPGPWVGSKTTTIECIEYLKPKPVQPAGTLNIPTVANVQPPASPSASGKSNP